MYQQYPSTGINLSVGDTHDTEPGCSLPDLQVPSTLLAMSNLQQQWNKEDKELQHQLQEKLDYITESEALHTAAVKRDYEQQRRLACEAHHKTESDITQARTESLQLLYTHRQSPRSLSSWLRYWLLTFILGRL